VTRMMGMGAVFGHPPGDMPAHEPWSESQVRYARFVRARVIGGYWSDGENATEFARFEKFRHTMPDDPRLWSIRDVRDFESRKTTGWCDGGIKDDGRVTADTPADGGHHEGNEL
jgi:hypothetical protein